MMEGGRPVLSMGRPLYVRFSAIRPHQHSLVTAAEHSSGSPSSFVLAEPTLFPIATAAPVRPILPVPTGPVSAHAATQT